MDFVGGGGGGSSVAASGGSLGSDNGPILYSEPNRTSAIDDIRSVVIYIFIITIFVSFFLILPGIRYEKFPTFLCITTSLIVTSIILVALFGTNWHVGEAPISAAYKAFSRDKIQGELSVRIGFQSVNITLRANRYYILHSTHGPIIMDNTPLASSTTSGATIAEKQLVTASTKPINSQPASIESTSSFITNSEESTNNFGDELLGGKTSDGSTVDTELDVDEVFAKSSMAIKQEPSKSRRPRSSSNVTRSDDINNNNPSQIKKQSTLNRNSELLDSEIEHLKQKQQQHSRRRLETGETLVISNGQRYTIKRVNVDINYNERFYWIEPNQMRQEHQNALARGLPYPILTVVEYLSQDEAGFSWSRQYRMAGYYSYIILWLSLCVCVLMFFLHCAAPKYGIYTMIILGFLLLLTNLTYAVLVPRGERKLVIPFEGQSLTFKFGWNFWLVLIGGGLSLTVGTLIVIIDSLFPNFIFTTILDVDFDSQNKYYKHRRKRHEQKNNLNAITERPSKPPFLDHRPSTTSSSATESSSASSKTLSSSTSSSSSSSSSTEVSSVNPVDDKGSKGKLEISATRKHSRNLPKLVSGHDKETNHKGAATRLSELFVEPANKQRSTTSAGNLPSKQQPTSDSESITQSMLEAQKRLQGNATSSVPIEMVDKADHLTRQRQSAVTHTPNTTNTKRHHNRQHHYADNHQYQPTGKNSHNLKSTDHLSQTTTTTTTTTRLTRDDIGDDSHQVHL